MGLPTVKLTALEVPPPGEGLKTVIEYVPTAAMSLAVIAALSWVLLTKEVVRAEPFHSRTDVEIKSLPVTVKVKPVPLAVVDDGERPVIDGTGLLCEGGAAEVPPPPPQPTSARSVTSIVPRRDSFSISGRRFACVSLCSIYAFGLNDSKY
jgi:hypothetical protein